MIFQGAPNRWSICIFNEKHSSPCTHHTQTWCLKIQTTTWESLQILPFKRYKQCGVAPEWVSQEVEGNFGHRYWIMQMPIEGYMLSKIRFRMVARSIGFGDCQTQQPIVNRWSKQVRWPHRAFEQLFEPITQRGRTSRPNNFFDITLAYHSPRKPCLRWPKLLWKLPK